MSDREKYPSEAADRFQVRFPPGLRDRIKAYAEAHGRSMNTEIVRVLEREFPEPEPIAKRMDDLMRLVGMMADSVDDVSVDQLKDAVLDTMMRAANGTIHGINEQARRDLRDRLTAWDIEKAEDAYNRYTEDLTDEEIDALGKRADPRNW